MEDTIRITVPGKPEYVGTVRLAVSHIANHAGFDIEAVEDIKVAVSEACTNAVCHGDTDRGCPYDVICALKEDRLVITVEDNAGGFNVDEYRMPGSDEIKESGFGIFVINAMMDEVDLDSEVGKGTSITMVKYRQAG